MVYILVPPVNKDIAVQQIAGEGEVTGFHSAGFVSVRHAVELVKIIHDHSPIATSLVVGV